MKAKVNFTRRHFLQFMGMGSALTLVGGSPLLNSCTNKELEHSSLSLPFTALEPTASDELKLASGFHYDLIIKWGDKINSKDETFGHNNDYTAFIPLGENEAILWVNNEYPTPLFVSGYTGGKKSKAQVEKEQLACGGSLIGLKKNEGRWVFNPDSPYNRRLTGQTKIPFVSSRPIEGKTHAIGTMGNCAGGVTPWKTILTCEENYQDYYGDRDSKKKLIDKSSYGWDEYFDYPPEHYGWVVEVDPLSGKARKHTSLGRFAHESATVTLASDGRVVIYSGDDANDQCLYKFISAEPGSFTKGTLYVANTERGEWISLSYEEQPILQKNFKDQLEVLTYCREAARLVGGTLLDRPEDIEIHPQTGSVIVALTNNILKGNYFGSLLKIEEEGSNPAALKFKNSTLMMGGPETGFACPDNLVFDRKGNLWMTTDIAGSAMNKPPYSPFKNNGLFYIPMSGALAGKTFQVASAPFDAELTGITFSDDGKTLFVSVQHPGEKSKSLGKLTSHWPLGKEGIPHPAVVAIRGEALEKLVRN